MSTDPHILIVTFDPCPECPPDGRCDDCTDYPEIDYAIECPGRTEQCRVWWECIDCTRKANADESGAFGEHLHEEPEHGVQHRWLGGVGYCTPGDGCAVQLADSLPDCASEVATEPGRYPVDYDFDDGELSRLTLLVGVA